MLLLKPPDHLTLFEIQNRFRIHINALTLSHILILCNGCLYFKITLVQWYISLYVGFTSMFKDGLHVELVSTNCLSLLRHVREVYAVRHLREVYGVRHLREVYAVRHLREVYAVRHLREVYAILYTVRLHARNNLAWFLSKQHPHDVQ